MLTWAIAWFLKDKTVTGEGVGCLFQLAIVADVAIVALVVMAVVY